MTTPNPPTDAQPIRLNRGDAIYARRSGNRTFAWYVIDRQLPTLIKDHVTAYAHRQHGVGIDSYMIFLEIRKIDAGRWA